MRTTATPDGTAPLESACMLSIELRTPEDRLNRLAGSTSPYLRQHADNPVDWWPWIPEAFAEAKRRNVPVHLSIGYAACHWCHVMARESFSDVDTAEQLNRDFVSIKVDREERPEVDQIYMRALHALGEQGGWPLTMFLTPDAEPFWGGTYFPPEPRWGRPSFRQILGAVSSAWTAQDKAVTENAASLREHLTRPIAPPAGAPDPKILDRAAETIASVWDFDRGSFRGAPKFPNPVVLETLWRANRRTGDDRYRSAVLNTLKNLCQGGIYDHVGGGFARYSVDAVWLVPHFEKMLYDNGLLLSALAYAQAEAPQDLFRQRIDETVAWLIREMQLKGGGFAASLDADTEHEEGLTYVWSADELRTALGEGFAALANVYGASDEGNWEGKIILNRLAPGSREWLGEAMEAELAEQRAKLLDLRNRRPQPARDDKVLADWNGLAIAGLAHAARVNGNSSARDAARAAFRFVSESMTEGERLAHSTLDGARVFPGIATDYANMIRAALSLFALEGDRAFLDRAERWFASAKQHHFVESASAYSLSADDAPTLIATPLSLADEATPAATGIMASNAATLFMLTGDDSHRTHAERLLSHLSSDAMRDVVGTASLQSAFDTMLRGRLAFVMGEGDGAEALLRSALAEADPALVAMHITPDALRSGHPAEGKRPTKAEAALLLCDASRCLPEIVTAGEAVEAFRATRRGLG
jgi:uncharacterized protein YyaL (SSP411 family)